MNSRIGSSFARSINSGNHEAAYCSGMIRITLTPGDWVIFSRTWGTILNGGKAYRRPLQLSQGTDMAFVHSALGSGYGDTNLMSRLLANVADKSICGSPHLANTGRRPPMAIIHSVFSGWLTTPCDRPTWAGVLSSALVCTIVCLPRPWCKPQSLHCRTSSKPPGTSDEAGSLSQHWWRPASPERWCATIFEMLTTVAVSSLSLTGLPSPNWTHLWKESLPSPWWRGESLAGLLEMPTRPPLTAPTEELWSRRSSSRSSGIMLWRPTTKPDENGVFPVVPVKPWTPACPVICADHRLWCLDWSSSVGERTGHWDASSVGAPLWIVECWTASQWTESPDLEWGLTSRSLWSSRETGAHWWSSGHAVAPVRENLHESASHLSRRVASHLAALIALRLVVRAWWTRGCCQSKG